MLCNELAESLSLNGTWAFALGEQSAWGTIEVPGCWEAQGYDRLIEGPAFYRKVVHLPKHWAGKRIQIEFGAVSYACIIRCNGVEAGQHTGLWTPFAIELTSTARPGEDNHIELEVYKPGGLPEDRESCRYPLRTCLAGFLPDLATSFGGIWQPVCLRALDTGLADVEIASQYAARTIHVRAQAVTVRPRTQPAWLVEILQQERVLAEIQTAFDPGTPLDLSLPVPGAQDWSPEQPVLFTVRVSLLDGGLPAAQVERRTGFRQLAAQGTGLLLNGQPFQVRGVLSWGWEPDRTAPTYTLEQARAEMRKAREMGFNLIKLCLFLPNPAYFDAADEEGMLLWQELPLWLPEVTPDLRERAPLEYAEIARGLAHHPAVVLYSLGCELNRSVDARLLARLDQSVRREAQDVLVCDNSGSGESYGGLAFDFSDFSDYHPYFDLHYFEPLLDHWQRGWQPPRPWILGEFCDSDTFRDLDEISAANGGTRPWWLTRANPVTHWRPEAQAVVEWDQRLADAGIDLPLREILQISYQQAFVIRKYTLEALRRRGLAGYVITGLRDTPISTSGIWDDLDRPKWPAEQFQAINGEAVLSLDMPRRRAWRNGGDRPDPQDPHNAWAGQPMHWQVILHHTGAEWPAGSRLDWSLTGPGVPPLAGSARLERGIPPGPPREAASIQVTLPQVNRAVQLTLDVQVSSAGRTARNLWPVWVYPRLNLPPAGLALCDPTGSLTTEGLWRAALPQVDLGVLRGAGASGRIVLTTVLDPALWEWTAAGGRVVLLQQGDLPLPARRVPFWREAVNWFEPHPLWERFPHPGFTGQQFFGLASDLAFDTARLPAALPPGAQIQPILRRLDAREFHMSAYLFEARIGAGLLLGCSLRLQGGMGSQPSGWSRNPAGAALLDALVRCAEQA